MTEAVTRWRCKPAEVSMIAWDGSDEALSAIAEASGAVVLRMQHLPDEGLASVWVARFSVRVVLAPGDWVICDPAGTGVYPVRGADHAALFEPAGDDEREPLALPPGWQLVGTVPNVGLADPLALGTFGEEVTVGIGDRTACLSKDQSEDFGRMYLSACWQAAANAARAEAARA